MAEPVAIIENPNLRKARGDIKRQLTASEKLLASIDSSTDFDALNLDFRLNKHLELWDKFDKIQSLLDDDLADEAAAEVESERTDFENRFHKICGLFKKYIKNPAFTPSRAVSRASDLPSRNVRNEREVYDSNPGFLSESNVIGNLEQLPSNSQSEEREVHQDISTYRDENIHNSKEREVQESRSIQERDQFRFRAQFELPKLQTPTFSGGYDTWLTFYDSFRSMCHDNPEISDIQKFHYLKACVKDEAAETIASLAITGENYRIAWETLRERFDNRKLIVESHTKAFLQIPNVSKEFTVRALLDNIQKRVRALKALGQPVEFWDTILICIIKEKLNNYLLDKWEETVGSTKLPSLKDMTTFLEQRSLIENTQATNRQTLPILNKGQPTKGTWQSRFQSRTSQACMATTVDSKTGRAPAKCHLCSGQHQLYSCERFINMSPSDRFEVVKKTSLCHNCLLGNHHTLDCRRSSCRKCQKRHNTLLHFSQEKPTEQESVQTKVTTAVASFQTQAPTQVVLGTAIIEILDSQGNYKTCRAFLDSCSQCCSIIENLANSLGLHKRSIAIQLKGAQNLQSQIKYSTSTKIKSRYDEDFELDVSFLIFKEIADAMPSMPINTTAMKIPDEIFLADPEFHRPSNIDVLIGAEYFFDLLLAGKIRVFNHPAVFQETVFGWIFSGRVNSNQVSKKHFHRPTGQLSKTELDSALHLIVTLTQSDAFASEIKALQKGSNVDSRSSLVRLTPFLDQGLLKVGGRLDRAEILESQKHPIVLPKNHHVTNLIIRDEHVKQLHAGTNATLYGVRENYWPIDGRNTTRHVVQQCVKCFRAKPREVNNLMGNLPKSRVSFTKPFLDVGVDSCSPFFTKEHRHRKRTKIKTYVSVFVHYATKAVHLELANNFTTDAFLACLKGLFARRGLTPSMNSDNAANFVGTNNRLKNSSKDLNRIIKSDQVQQYLLNKEITWRFIPPRAPHFGGLWEAAAKSVKSHFVRIAGNTFLKYEQLHTYVVEIESILKSHPFTPLSSDPNHLNPSTPGHFLIDSSMTSIPQDDLRQVPANRLNCWDSAQQMWHHLWDRWHKKHLNEMISRSKCQSATNQDNITAGTLVVVKEDNLPSMKWSLLSSKHIQDEMELFEKSHFKVILAPFDVP